ncbi:MAG: hypothetical protein AB1341_14835 [Bacillota bacterium]
MPRKLASGLTVLFLAIGIIFSQVALADSSSYHQSMTHDMPMPAHETGINEAKQPDSLNYGHQQNQSTHQDSATDRKSIEHSGYGQASNLKTEPHDGGHDTKQVKEINIKPWVNALLAYIVGVLSLAIILKRGKSRTNELVK